MWPFTFSTGYTIYSPSELHNRSFDYIVVGGGTAGCVLASRLSEDKSKSVLLIERGPIVNSWLSRVPLISVDFRTSWSPTYKWQSVTNDVSNGVAAASMVAGKALGGTSKINAHVYTRSVPGEYNAWTESGRKGWSWEDVEPYFKKSETSLTHGYSSHRGNAGPWRNRHLTDIPFQCVKQILEAADSLGLPRREDVHDPSVPPYACGLIDVTVDENGQRHSTYDAFMNADIMASRSGNLFVCTETVVTKLDVRHEGDGLHVAGVFMQTAAKKPIHGQQEQYYVSAKLEVIMCSGAIVTPQILMLSGIGPRKHLESMKIQVKKEISGVGASLKDHPCVPLVYKVARADSLHELASNYLVAVWHLLLYIFTGTGLLLSPNPQMIIFALSKLLDGESRTPPGPHAGSDSHLSSNIPDIEFTTIPYNVFDDSKLDRSDGVVTLACILLKPKSSGTIRLASLNPHDRPECDLEYLRRDEDYKVLRKALRLGLAIGRKCREQGHNFRDFLRPTTESDADIDQYVRNRIRTTFHYTSTCRMAPEDELGVVDDELRVHGVRNLRIADASIFPDVPAAHPQAPVVMVAERCADFVKKAHA